MTFHMQAWDSRERGWRRMEEGAGGRTVWRPRKTAPEAIEKCRAWTGDIGIPAMQVVDADGLVVWRDATAYPDVWPSVEHNLPPWVDRGDDLGDEE